MFSLGINDSDRWCTCEGCRALCPPEERESPPRERWWSDPYWRFVNDVARDVGHSPPGRLLGALAYGAVVEPPAGDLIPLGFSLQSPPTPPLLRRCDLL